GVWCSRPRRLLSLKIRKVEPKLRSLKPCRQQAHISPNTESPDGERTPNLLAAVRTETGMSSRVQCGHRNLASECWGRGKQKHFQALQVELWSGQCVGGRKLQYRAEGYWR
ncbi:uncharacterized, partial [Tachysurus ichikawai]